MSLSTDERAHARDDHSACGGDTDCHEIWLAELARAGENSVIQVHVAERHHLCPSTWRCHQAWMEAEREYHDTHDVVTGTPIEREESVVQESTPSQPLEADGGGRVEAVVEHHMRGFVEQDLHHHNTMHPQVLEVHKGDILLLPSRTGTDLMKPSNEHESLIRELGVEAVYTSRLLTQPFILRKADDE